MVMSIRGLLIRFGVAYVALIFVVGNLFGLLGIANGHGGEVNTVVLLATVMAVTMWFCQKNGRPMEPGEKRRAALGMWAIDMAFQALMTLFVLGPSNQGLMSRWVLAIFVVIAVVHGLLIFAVVRMASRLSAGSAARRA